MNFLAHLQLAQLAKSSLLGNLLADFVRGSSFDHYPDRVVQGIYFHRRVDTFSDNLPIVKEARELFGKETRRVAPITLDVVWDHFLARHWSGLQQEMSLKDFNQRAERQVGSAIQGLLLPRDFLQLNQVLWREQWLIHYADLPFIEQVLIRMAKRRPKLLMLAQSFDDIQQHYQQLEQLFWQFYPQLQQNVQKPQFLLPAQK